MLRAQRGVFGGGRAIETVNSAPIIERAPAWLVRITLVVLSRGDRCTLMPIIVHLSNPKPRRPGTPLIADTSPKIRKGDPPARSGAGGVPVFAARAGQAPMRHFVSLPELYPAKVQFPWTFGGTLKTSKQDPKIRNQGLSEKG